jgi:predicted ATP-grasp superfamily ATP-dependent carboligase
MTAHVIVAGMSTRAAADSAARAGFDVTAIDAFGDLDQHRGVRALTVPRGTRVAFTPRAAVNVARGRACDAVVYLSNFENHHRAVEALTAGRQLWGNDAAVLRRVRNPALVSQVLCDRGLSAPRVRLREADLDAEDRRRHWLVKPRRSGGGDRIRPWQPEVPVPPTCYLQEHVEGTPGSVAFVAAAGRAAPLAICAQLIGERAFGGAGYRYCGNILPNDSDVTFTRTLVDAVAAIARAIAEAFGLIGVNGIDFVVRDGVPYPVEVNPRWTASMELVEAAHGISVFDAHARACNSGELPAFDAARARHDSVAFGKAIIYAQQMVTLGDTRSWLGDATIHDVPHPGERIDAGRPVCTVFASGTDVASCRRALIDRAARVYAELERWRSSCKVAASS